MHIYNLQSIYYLLLFVFIKLLCANTNASENIDLAISDNNNTKVVVMNDITQTDIDIFPKKTYITQQFKCEINNEGFAQLEFNIYELTDTELQIFFDNGTELISADQINYTYEALGNDLLFRHWVGKPVDILGGGLAATVSGTLIKYENKKAFVKGINGRFYLVSFKDPQGMRIFLKRDSGNDMYYYQHIITAKFANLKNKQGSLVVKYKTSLVTADVYYSFYKKNGNNIYLDLRSRLKNDSSATFHNPKVTIFNDNCILALPKDNNKNNNLSSKISNKPIIEVNNNSISLLKAKNIHDILIKNYKSINIEEAYIVDMVNSQSKINETLKIANRCYMLNSDEIFPNAKVIISAVQDELLIDTLGHKHLYYNQHINKNYIILNKDKNVTAQNSINTETDKHSASIFNDSNKIFWNALIQNDHKQAISMYLIYGNGDVIGDVKSGNLIGNSCINLKIPEKTNKAINYSKLLLL